MVKNKYRKSLPQLSQSFFLTDGGLETTLIFQRGIELPCFASFPLLKDAAGEKLLWDYFVAYVELAKKYGTGFIAESATWRANPDWGQKLGYDQEALNAVNRKAIEQLLKLRERYESEKTPIVISGCLGPRGDGYQATKKMSTKEAADYHREQIHILNEAGADLVSAFTMNYVEEALGIVRAAQAEHAPVVISFTLETDGSLPSGQSLKDAVRQVDVETRNGPAYYMINCAHPTHFESTIDPAEAWVKRIQGIRANASRKSHKELDESTELDAGNPAELGEQCALLRNRWPSLMILGGCCGTDERHVEAVATALQTSPSS